MATPAASNAELTAQIVTITTEVQVLKNRLMVAEQNAILQSQGNGNKNVGGVFDN